MTRNQILYFSLISILISIIIPIVLKEESESYNQTFGTIATIIGSIASTLTLVIAILLYNRFGIESTLLEKNSFIVFSFLEKLKQTRIMIQSDRATLFLEINSQTLFEDQYGEILLFSSEYYEGLQELSNIADSPFMPRSIADKFNQMKFSTISFDVAQEDIHKFATVSFIGYSHKDILWGKFNGENMTLMEYLNILEEIRFETIKWITEKSILDPNLNV
jgi:hypothetical protein